MKYWTALACLPLAIFAGEYGQPAERTIFRAIERNDPVSLLEILGAHKESVSFPDSRHHSPLMRAILKRNPGLVGQLLESGADANPPGAPLPPLHLSILVEIEPIVLRLLEKGAAVDAQSHAGHSPLHIAAFSGNASATRMLLDRKARTDQADGQGRTPLHLAAIRGHTAIIEQLLLAGAPREARSLQGLTPFLEAVISGQIPATRTFLRTEDKEIHKTTLQATDPVGRNALHLAAEIDSAELIVLCLAQGLPIDSRDRSGLTPLHIAARDAREGALRALLDAGANPHILSSSLQTPLQLLQSQSPSFANRSRGSNAARIQFFLEQAAFQKSIDRHEYIPDSKWPLH
ncbi:MAG: ankyrin repeat domain-containing protein [Spirochaetales bacterium]|nr:ankyrin repeat domain-containing protein [Spirochaetales bacterium]